MLSQQAEQAQHLDLIKKKKKRSKTVAPADNAPADDAPAEAEAEVETKEMQSFVHRNKSRRPKTSKTSTRQMPTSTSTSTTYCRCFCCHDQFTAAAAGSFTQGKTDKQARRGRASSARPLASVWPDPASRSRRGGLAGGGGERNIAVVFT